MQANAAAATRKDNLLGICNALGEDFGFNPIYLRIMLATGLIWKPEIVLGIYAILGLSVLTSRLLTRPRSPSVADEAAPANIVPLPVRAEPPLRKAA